MNTKFLTDRAEVHFNTSTHLYIILVSVLVLIVGVLALKKLEAPNKYILPLMGAMGIVIGFIFWFTKQNVMLVIDKKAQTIQIQEKTKQGLLTSTLPFDNFNALIVQRAVSISRNNSAGTSSKSVSFQIQLKRNDGAMVKLATYHQLNNAYEFVSKLKKIVPYQVYIIDAPMEEYKTGVQKLKQLEGAQVLDDYTPLLKSHLTTQQTPAKIQLPTSPGFDKTHNAEGTTYQWSNRKNIAVMLLGVIFITGFIFLIQLIDHKGIRLGANIFMGLICLAMVAGLINSAFGTSYLHLGKQQLTHKSVLFGKTIGSQSWNYSQLAEIMSELGTQGDQSIQLSSKKGQDLLHQLAHSSPENLVSQMMGLISHYKSYFMTIDVSGLLLSERLYLELEIAKKMTQSQSESSQ
ncbi:hypothetical protein [Microscilla marina]|uniref:Uncharacterized protein n=1 Tax=Microscilla marina ATCC 23134 TaxID=313606 RepID=A1ZM59_MICM2|nr:hypothetical protein [Microscilla marina]EAY28591.1 hypothetical protein M23134_04438 [Microscilla marina ATCC 23134]